MDKAFKLSLFAGLVTVILFFALRNCSVDSDSTVTIEEDSGVSVPNSKLEEFINLKVELGAFLELEAGHFSSVTANNLLDKLKANPEAANSLAKEFQNDATLANRLMGLFMELELAGYSDDLREYTLGQKLILFGAATARWLYLQHEFDDWSGFLQSFSENDVADKAIQLFAYLDNPTGNENFPAGFSLLQLGEVDERFMKEFLRRSAEAQDHFRNHLIESEVSPVQRNAALMLLKRSGSEYFEEVVNHFVDQFPENSQSYNYLVHLRDRSADVEVDSLRAHLENLETQSSNPLSQFSSVEAVLEAMEENPDIPIELTVLETMEGILTGIPLQTQVLKHKAADVAYAQWSALSR